MSLGLKDINFGLNDDPASLLQQGVAIASDLFTRKAIIYEKPATPTKGTDDKGNEDGQNASNLRGTLKKGMMSGIDTIKGAVGIGKLDNNGVTLYHYTDITDSVEAEYADTPIRGRSQPYIHYTGTGTNKVSFTAKLVAGGDTMALFHTADDMIRSVNTIKSWVYPLYPKDGATQPPPTLILDAGDLYRGVPGIIRSANFVYQQPWTFKHLPMIIDVNIEFEIVFTTPVDRDHIRVNGMTDGTTAQPTSLLSKAANIIDKYTDNIFKTGDTVAKGVAPNAKNPGLLGG